jgi:hypothetical protein
LEGGITMLVAFDQGGVDVRDSILQSMQSAQLESVFIPQVIVHTVDSGGGTGRWSMVDGSGIGVGVGALA